MLTRDQQDVILLDVILACREVDRAMGSTRFEAREHNLASFRAALRLDDKSLDHAIAFGAHKHPWQSEVPA